MIWTMIVGPKLCCSLNVIKLIVREHVVTPYRPHRNRGMGNVHDRTPPQYSRFTSQQEFLISEPVRLWARSSGCSGGREAQMQRVTSGVTIGLGGGRLVHFLVGKDNSRCCRWVLE